MATIIIRKRIDSETLHLPELKPLIGKTVEIVVREERPAALAGPRTGMPPFRRPGSWRITILTPRGGNATTP
jgi:hypothetical protein